MNSNEKKSKSFPEKEHIFPGKTNQNKSDNNSTKVSFPIVGIGASAGGLEALEKFFKAMPENAGIAFVVVMHLDPNHKSILSEILQKFTKMQVVLINDNLKVVPNKIFIIPPNKRLSIFNGSLYLFKVNNHELIIDSFFTSLAADQGSNSNCIIFSGTGTDGTKGLSSIKEESGLVIVQDKDSSKYDGMPGSAIATGLADAILVPEKMPEYIIESVKDPERTSSKENIKQYKNNHDSLREVLNLLRKITSYDFSQYKEKTIFRRIEKRMFVNKKNSISDYLSYSQQNTNEMKLLFKELLIGVTNFFRNPDAFEALKETYLPRLFANFKDNSNIRIWIPGCSTGEEVYSIAIIIKEYLNIINKHFNVQIFGTDICEDYITTARTGIYPEFITADVKQERIDNFFIKKEGCYHIRKSIREMVVFAPHNLINDPPFTKLDMLCCRNLLIYFTPELQKKLISSFHYSLKNGGILFLGSSESTAQHQDYFSILDKKWKIYKKLPLIKPLQPIINFSHKESIDIIESNNNSTETVKPIKQQENTNIIKLLKAILSHSSLPPCAVIDKKGDILYIYGRTGRFLEPAQGETSLNIFKMARHGLKTGLLKAVNKVKAQQTEVRSNKLKVRYDGNFVEINLIIRPLQELQTEFKDIMLVLFQESISSINIPKTRRVVSIKDKEKKDTIEELEEELLYTKETLELTSIELETNNNELRSLNEELQSTNEELQSTNEELETSKEELQSLNEESNTLNSELQNRIDKLTTANDDIKNLLDATEIATVFLNIDLKIRRFTPCATEIFPLISADIGRPITDFASNLIGIDLYKYSEKVLNDLTIQEFEAKSRNKIIYRVKVKPYRTINNVIDGVVITFEDITKLKIFEHKISELSLSFEKKLLIMSKVFMDNPNPIIVENINGVIVEANNEVAIFYGIDREKLIGNNSDILIPQEHKTELLKVVEQCKVKGLTIRDFKGIQITSSGKLIPVLLTFSPIFDLEGNICGIATIAKKDQDM